jgi:hypothetical protein
MALSVVSDKDVLRIWKTMTKRQARIRKEFSTHILCGADGENQQRKDANRQRVRAELDDRGI